ncbi:MAG: sugar phosphate isomerase/epimerase [Chitinophagaceae bacterium]|nr:sugar phosphate isomerase/epimerase [Chitinophagaceae bacterium]
MQLGIGSYTYGWNVEHGMNDMNLIERAKEFGVKLIQIGDNLPLHTFNEERLQVFGKALRQNDITVEIGAKGLLQLHLHQYILLCKRFNAKILRFIIDDNNYRPTVEEVIRIIKSEANLLQQYNITLALENHDGLKADEYAAIIKSINSPNVGICLDTVNSMGAGESIETILETLLPYTVNLHIKDFGIARLPHKQGFIIDGRIAGEGLLNIPLLLEKLKARNRCHTCIVEQWVPPEKDKGETNLKEIHWAERSIRYLKALPSWE